MVELIGVAVVLAGLVLLFAGAALSVYGVAILGVVVGGGVGYLVAPTVGGLVGLEGILAVVVATAVGVVAGLVLSYLLLSMAVAAMAFVAGAYAGLLLATAVLGASSVLVYPAAMAVGFVAATLGGILTRTILVFVTAFVGATLASGSLTVADVATAGEDLALEPLLIDLAAPVFLVLFALGVLTQFGLFKLGYVTRLVSLLPGASVVTDRGGDGEREATNR